MAFFPHGDHRIIGCFNEVENGGVFEYRTADAHPDPKWNFPHQIAVDQGREMRYARVLKTVVYVAVDEDAFGNPVMEKWKIKMHRMYRQ